ncbi:MAG: TIM-barrel domain-containing protein [Bacteroidales bacterium]|nr:TIM-barrel domain-containing protein [Bacteroidales bacterium]
MIKKTSLLIFIMLLVMGNVSAQIAWLEPSDPTPFESVTITYNSNEGNKALAGYEGTVYLHTGVITQNSIDGGDWKHVVGNWGEDDERVKMTSVGNGIHQFQLVINDFYGLRPDEIPQQLAFVFRSVDGAKVGKTANNEDIFLNVNGYRPPEKEKAKYLFDDRKYMSHRTENGNFIVKTNYGIVQIIPLTNRMVEVKHFDGDQITKDSSVAVILQARNVKFKIADNQDHIKLQTDSLELLLYKNPFAISFVFAEDTILEEERGFFKRTDNSGLRFKIDANEKMYGLGERANAFDLVGARYNLYNRPKYGYEIGARNLNYSVPLVVSSKKYLLFFDNPQKGYADIGETENGILEWGAIGGLMKYTVIAGDDFKSLSKDYATLTGFQPLPPRWALGNLQSRMAYRTQYETDSIVTLMQEKDFPIDAIILDFYWFGDSILGTLGRLRWYKPNWPEPELMIAKFKDKGVKTVLITEPYILDSIDNFQIAAEKGILARDSLGNPYINYGFYFGNGGLIDMFNPAAGEWFWEQYKKQMEIGVAGWWGDLGEPESHPSDIYHINGKADEVHNIYAHYWHKFLDEKFKEDYPERRLFNLNRAGYAGSQHYSIYPWTGDVSRSWGGLQAQLPLMLHMSLSGLPFIHSDAGGFAQGTKDEELYTRWLQMSCFSPILRPHGSGIPSEPVYFNDTTQRIVRSFMNLRYQLLPYIYTTTYAANAEGTPIVRPLFYEFPEDSITYDLVNEYMFGENMLVAPVIEQGQETIQVYLPSDANWYDYWDNDYYKGGQWIEMKTNLETIPIFIKAGSFIPMVPAVNSTDNYTSEKMTIRYYVDEEEGFNTSMMYEDDGETFPKADDATYELLNFNAISNDNLEIFNFSSTKDNASFTYSERQINFEIIGLKSLNFKKIQMEDAFGFNSIIGQKNSNETGTWYFKNDDTGVLYITFEWEVNTDINISMHK